MVVLDGRIGQSKTAARQRNSTSETINTPSSSKTVLVENMTITGNETTSGYGGGLWSYNMHSTMVISASTLSGNTAMIGGGLAQDSGTTVYNSVITQNTAASSGPDCYPVVSITKTSFIGELTDCKYTLGAGQVIMTTATHGAALLGALANNGGLTETMLPEAASPLIDAVTVACNNGGINLPQDQRNYPRSDGQCDLGAVEQ